MDSREAQRRAQKGPTEEAVRDEAAAEEDRVGASAGDSSPAGPSEHGDVAQAAAEEAAAVVDPDEVIDPEGSSAEAEAGAEGATTEPQDPVAVAQRERDEYLAVAQRTQADFENYRKRAAKESAVAGERARSGLVRELLPVVDNLERALATADAQEDHLTGGVRMVHTELLAVLERNGVNQFDPAGEPFDPNCHEALSTRSQDGADPGVVLDVVERGYRLGDSVLRPARVVVSG